MLRKMHRKNIPLTIQSIEENIHDIAGVRVVCAFQEDIYKLADCLLAQDDITLITRKDYIENPKPSGYRSLHLIVEVPIFLSTGKRSVKVEVQFRTIAMDFWASLEHKLHYKKNLPEETSRILTSELKDCAEKISELDCRMQTVRTKLQEQEEKESDKQNDFNSKILFPLI